MRVICGAGQAFAALRKDGTVVSWGDEGLLFVVSLVLSSGSFLSSSVALDSGGDSSSVRSDLNEVVSISSTYWAFAARRSNGTVVTWGRKGWRHCVFPFVKWTVC